MNCYIWELEALIEGSMLRQLDERERYAEMAFNLRYVMNVKKPKPKKVFNKEKEEKRIHDIFVRKEKKSEQNAEVERIKRLNEHFMNRKWGE